jgi:hypothetical protein
MFLHDIILSSDSNVKETMSAKAHTNPAIDHADLAAWLQRWPDSNKILEEESIYELSSFPFNRPRGRRIPPKYDQA